MNHTESWGSGRIIAKSQSARKGAVLPSFRNPPRNDKRV
jgi:hypothetical protein